VADDQRSGDPPYRVIAGDLRDRIESGEFRPGDALPSITRLSQEYEVAKTTAQKALQVLKDEGLARGVQGWGTIVAERR
jgi:DNA-binding GntR family transcriptional regulator